MHARTINFQIPIDLTLIGAIPHMHLIGRRLTVCTTNRDGWASH